MDQQDFELLEALRAHKTLTAAARRLFVSQPALSRRLTRLEQRVGARLFDRLDRRLEPTEAGHRLLRTVEVVLTELRTARRDLDMLADDRAVEVGIAAQYASADVRHQLPAVLGGFHESVGDIRIRYDEESEHDLVGALEDGRIDLALIGVLGSAFARVRLTPLLDYELRAVLAADHPWAQRPYISIADFGKGQLILPAQYDQPRSPHLPMLPGDTRPAGLTIVPGEFAAFFELVAQTHAVTVVPSCFTGHFGDRRLVSRQVGEWPLYRTWYAATRPGPQPAPVVEIMARMRELLRADRGTEISLP